MVTFELVKFLILGIPFLEHFYFVISSKFLLCMFTVLKYGRLQRNNKIF